MLYISNMFTRYVRASLLGLLLGGAPLFADTVMLRNGRRYENVRTVFHARELHITFEGGRTIIVQPLEVLSVDRRPVRWRRKVPTALETAPATPIITGAADGPQKAGAVTTLPEPAAPLSAAPASGADGSTVDLRSATKGFSAGPSKFTDASELPPDLPELPESVDAPEPRNPWVAALLGLIPGYSGLYGNDQILGGLALSGTELYLGYRVYAIHKSAPAYGDSMNPGWIAGFFTYGYVASVAARDPSQPLNAYIAINAYQKAVETSALRTDPRDGGRSLTEEQLIDLQREANLAFGAVVLLDVVLSYISTPDPAVADGGTTARDTSIRLITPVTTARPYALGVQLFF